MSCPVLALYGNVGPVSGSIRHDGDVRVLGSVLPGHRVTAGGNVFVTRHVRGAKIHAGGGVAVNGIVGPNSVIEAVGAVSVMQVTDARILAGLDIEVRTAAERSDLAAGRRIVLTGPPGLLRGGRARAGVGVEAARIEASGGSWPELDLGRMPFEEDAAVLAEQLEYARKQATRTVDGLHSDPDAYRRVLASVRANRNLAATIERRLARIEKAAGCEGTPYLRVTGTGPVRAIVTLGGSKLPAETGPMEAVLEEGMARVRSLEEAVRE